MNSSILLALFAFLLITTIIVFVGMYRNLKKRVASYDLENNQLRISYDQIRKEKLSLDDQLHQATNQERTYKVAFEDWKSKYDLMELKYNNLKREYESKSITINDELKSVNGLEDSKELTSSKTNSNTTIPLQELNKITDDLRTVLNQHLEILDKIINQDGDLKLNEVPVKSDPLHWIMGIDEDTSNILKNQGIRTFEQVYELPKKDLRKLMVQFDDIDDRIIESWPMQAGAILRSRSN